MKKSCVVVFIVLSTFLWADDIRNPEDRVDFPKVTIKNLRGRSVYPDKILGRKLTLVNFWATWCIPCMKEMKELNRLHLLYENDNFQVVGISIDDSRTVRRVSSVVKAKKVVYPIYLDTDQTLYKQFNSTAMPFSVLVSPNGQILWEHTGYIPGDEKIMEEIILKALNMGANSVGKSQKNESEIDTVILKKLNLHDQVNDSSNQKPGRKLE